MVSIVVVDHVPETAERWCRYLCEEGYEVAAAHGAAAALEVLAAEQPELVLVDLALPAEEVSDFCRHLKSDPQWQDVAVVLAEGELQSGALREGMAAGADDYVVEPCNKEILLGRVRSVLRARTDRDTITRMNRHMAARIEAQEAAEAARAALDLYLRHFVEHSGSHLDVVDAQLKLRYVDPAWRAVLGDYHGKTHEEYFPGRYATRPESPLVEALRTRQTIVVEHAVPAELGCIWRASSVPFTDEQGQWLVAEISRELRVES